MKEYCFTLLFVLGLAVSASAQEIVVPNSNFEEIYLPGSTTITGVITGFDWTAGVGPDCSIDPECLGRGGGYNFSDGTFGTVADIPGWVGYDRDGWIALGGSYGRDQTTGNYQGAIQANGVDGSYCYLANGSGWGNPAGGLIVSDASLGNVEDGIYTLSMVARGGAAPVVLNLLAGGIVLTPTSSVDPGLSGDFQEFSRTYDSDSLVGFLGEPLTICLGVSRGASGGQTQFDNVSLILETVSPAPDAPTNLTATAGDGKVDLAWTAPAAGTTPTGYQVFRGTTKIADVPATPTTYTDSDASLVPGTEYCYTVKSVAGVQTSVASNESCGTLAPAAPNPPTNLVATGDTKQVSLAWSAPASGTTPTGYEVFRGDAKIADVPANPTTYTDSDVSLVPGTLYCYTVKSKAGDQTSVASNESCGTPKAAANFKRADMNDDGTQDISDAVYLLSFLYVGGLASKCPDAGHINNDPAVDISDAVYLLSFLYTGGPAPPYAGYPACEEFPTCAGKSQHCP